MRASEPVNVLVVADVPETVAAVEAILDDLGHHVVQARTGDDAQRCLRKDDFAVVLLDLHLADTDGVAFAARLRKRKKTEDTPIIFVTDHADETVVAKCQLLGTVDCVSTPLNPQILRTKVSLFVDLHEKTATIRQQVAHRVQLAREQAARQVAEKAMRRSALLAEASRLLSRSLDFDTTLQSLHRAVVPALADACQLVLYDSNGELWFAPVDSQEPDGDDAPVGSSSRVQAASPTLAHVVRDAVETGQTQSISEEIVRGAPNLGRNKGWTSVIVAPLIARDNPLGAIVCGRQCSRPGFESADVALVEDLAGRAATALDNAQLYQTIREGEQRKDEFLAMLGHELRNPLAAITNAGELTRLLSPTDPAFQETLEIIRQQATLMKRLVDDLLDVSRISSGRVQLQKSTVVAGEILARVAEATSPLFTSRNHSLHLSVPEERICFEADACRLEQILSNLMVNSAKYTDPGGEIWLSAARQGEEVVFRVKDNGIGIGPDLLPNVFDLFSQANRSLHRAEGGLGIGLTIVKGLAELHGGHVRASSGGIGRGAEFVVCLPAIATTPPVNSDSKPLNLTAHCHRRRVLVVEDQPSLLRVTVALLRKLGHEVRSAVDGPEALLAVREYGPEIVFLDIGLPGMDGYEVAHCLRAEMGSCAPLLVAMTGYSQHEVKRHALKAQFDHHLVKPADIGTMQMLLSQVG
jgi:signal transduction histidine kinase/DNA-binding response OmpR family regulator